MFRFDQRFWEVVFEPDGLIIPSSLVKNLGDENP